jgi:hypothetical protein
MALAIVVALAAGGYCLRREFAAAAAFRTA